MDVGQGSDKSVNMRVLCEKGGLALVDLFILFWVKDRAVIQIG